MDGYYFFSFWNPFINKCIYGYSLLTDMLFFVTLLESIQVPIIFHFLKVNCFGYQTKFLLPSPWCHMTSIHPRQYSSAPSSRLLGMHSTQKVKAAFQSSKISFYKILWRIMLLKLLITYLINTNYFFKKFPLLVNIMHLHCIQLIAYLHSVLYLYVLWK